MAGMHVMMYASIISSYALNFYTLLNDQIAAPTRQYEWLDNTLAAARANNEKAGSC